MEVKLTTITYQMFQSSEQVQMRQAAITQRWILVRMENIILLISSHWINDFHIY